MVKALGRECPHRRYNLCKSDSVSLHVAAESIESFEHDGTLAVYGQFVFASQLVRNRMKHNRV